MIEMEGRVAVGRECAAARSNETDDAHLQSCRAEGYAFLNHSSATLPNNLPPTVDDKQLARQKRKRTSPEDQAILEAAYSRDSKPDKAARLELVKQVALGEKEVQIWFQNRRQTSRRKSRPLLPHEIAQYHLARSGYHNVPLDIALEPLPNDSVVLPPLNCSRLDSRTLHRAVEQSSPPALSQSNSSDDSLTPVQTHSSISTDEESAATSLDGRNVVGYLANRRSAPSLRVDAMEHAVPGAVPTNTSQLKSSSSLVRIALTGDGKAQVITKDGASPSPPRPLLPPAALLAHPIRPQSALQEAVPPHRSQQPRTLHRSSSVRARDSRTWEFWCDKEARNELGTAAEKDASGSAADAIDLLRSTSGRKVLSTLSSRRNNVLSRHPSFLQRKNFGARLPGLQKSSTSLGRLQGSSKMAGNGMANSDFIAKAGVDVRIPGNDSDKENWSPQSYEQSESSTEDHRASIYENGTSLGKHAAGTQNINDNRLAAEISIAAVASSDKRTTSFSEAEDLDCIQGLLSLSQGNWR